MLTWLESWLHSIIAVVLFAVIVELLLPNSKFLRYTRLVIGLILLITILSPILKIFEKDYLTQIDASYALWEKQLSSTEAKTLSLKDIEAKAKDLQEKRNSQTLTVTGQAIAKQMEQELQQANLMFISRIDVELGINDATKQVEPFIKHVVVTVSSSEITENDDETVELINVDDIQDVDISINEHSTILDNNKQQPDNQLALFEEADIQLIYTVLQRNWNIKQNQISIVAK